MIIKRVKRFFEDCEIEEYTGLIILSNREFRKDTKKEIKINCTKFYFDNLNSFPLYNKYYNEDDIKKYINKNLYILKENILDIYPIFKKKNKVIYIVYIDFSTKTHKLYEYPVLNMYKINKNTEDVYTSILNYSKKYSFSNYKLFFDKSNIINVNLKNIFYYLQGNDIFSSS